MSQILLADEAEQSLKNTAMLAYVLIGVSLFTALPTGLVGVIIAHVKREDARGSWLQTHYDFLISTFWLSVLGMLLGGALCLTIIGIPLAILLWAGVWLWTLYRTIKGALWLNDERPIES
ncbi:DUF4870 family protein [Chitinimonas koreensis]|uniref:DUF4870 family protein n=1 Tax=Chitinimonas koreensis TaxID=356302 RepID=UPI0003F9C3F2|nr:hypothetical protein [Chitinimonas koreensis]QNM97866.1 hypothetical protein H9L41_06255 [Chitinimonas koreensis]